MKYLFLLFTLFTFSSFGQVYTDLQTYQDSVVNAADRPFREVLNQSDYDLISESLMNIKNENCTCFENEISNKDISDNYLKQLILSIINQKLCLNNIVDYVSYKRMSSAQYDPEYIYPFYEVITKTPSARKTIIEYLNNSQYLNNCALLPNIKPLQLYFFKGFINELLYMDKSQQSCKNANLFILQKISDVD